MFPPDAAPFSSPDADGSSPGNTPRYPSVDFTLLEPLLVRLRERGFPIGIEDYTLLQRLLERIDPQQLANSVPENERADALKHAYRRLLCPLFATTSRQQEQFEAIFEEFCAADPLAFSGIESEEADAATKAVLDRLTEEADRKRAAKEEWRRREERREAERRNQRQREEEEGARRKLRARRLRILAALSVPLALIGGAFALLWFTRAEYAWEPKEQIAFSIENGKERAPTTATATLKRLDARPALPFSWFKPRFSITARDPIDKASFRLLPEKKKATRQTREITVEFAPTRPEDREYHGRLRVHSRNPFDHPAVVPLVGSVKTPQPGYKINPSGTITFGSGKPLSQQFTLTLEQGGERLSFLPQANHFQRKGPDKDQFSITQPRDVRRGTEYHFTVTFAPTSGKTEYNDQILYRSPDAGVSDSNSVSLMGRIAQTADRPIRYQEVAVTIGGGDWPTRPGPLPLWRAIGIPLFAFLLPLLLLRMAVRFPRRIPPQERSFEWPVQPNDSPAPFTGSRLTETAHLLAPPVARTDRIGDFDVPASIDATAKNAGFSYPVYRSALTSTPDYLVLIALENYRDQQGAYFLALVRALKRRGVTMEVYTFATDPQLCVDLDETSVFPLEKLLVQRPEHRVLVFGNSEQFVSPGENAPTEAARLLAAGRAWALFTPENELHPPATSLQLQAVFPPDRVGLYPATLPGLCRFARAFPVGRPARPEAGLPDQIPDAPLPPMEPTGGARAEIENYLDDLEDYFRHDYFRHDPRLFLWLCACALYPRLSYDLTILLGLIVADSHPEGPGALVTEENFLGLLRLPWFRRGEMPDSLRMALQKRLRQLEKGRGANDTLEYRVRRYLVELLTRSPLPPYGFVAFEHFDLERRVQDWLLEQPTYAHDLRKALKELPTYLTYTHPLLLEMLRQREFDLWADAPRFWRWIMHRLFHYGIPSLRYLRLHYPALLLGLACLSLLAWLIHTPLGPRISDPSQHTPLALTLNPTAVNFDPSAGEADKILRFTINRSSGAFEQPGEHLLFKVERSSSGTANGQTSPLSTPVDRPNGTTLNYPLPTTIPRNGFALTSSIVIQDANGKELGSNATSSLSVTSVPSTFRFSPPNVDTVGSVSSQTPLSQRFTLSGNTAPPSPETLQASSSPLVLDTSAADRGKFSISQITAQGTDRQITLSYDPTSLEARSGVHKATLLYYGRAGVLAQATWTITYGSSELQSVSLTPRDGNVRSSQSTIFTLRASYTNGTVRDVTRQATITQFGGNGRMEGNIYRPAPGEQSRLTITGTYTENSVAKSDTTSLAVSTPHDLASVTLTPTSSTIYSDETQTFKLTAHYADTGNQEFDVTNQATFSQTGGSGRMNGSRYEPVPGEQSNLTVTGRYTENGRTVTARASLTVRTPPHDLVSASLSPMNNTIYSDETQSYKMTARYRDQPTLDVDVTNQATFSQSGGKGRMNGNAYQADPGERSRLTITGSYMENGKAMTATASLAVNIGHTLTGATLTPANSTIASGGAQTFKLTVRYADTGNQEYDVTDRAIFTATRDKGLASLEDRLNSHQVDPAAFRQSTGGQGRMNGNVYQSTTGERSRLTITGSYAEKGKTVTSMTSLTVATPHELVSAIITPANSTIASGASQAFTLTVRYADTGDQDYDVTNRATFTATRDNAAGEFGSRQGSHFVYQAAFRQSSGGQGRMNRNVYQSASREQSRLIITGRYTERGKTVSANTVLIVRPDKYPTNPPRPGIPVSARLLPESASVEAGKKIAFTLIVTFDDGVAYDVNLLPATTFTLNPSGNGRMRRNEYAAPTSRRTNQSTPSTNSVTVTGSFTHNKVTVSANAVVTIDYPSGSP